MQCIVFGVNGYIGSYIFQQLNIDGIDVIGTSHRSQNMEKIYSFDILYDKIDGLLEKIVDENRVAIICIAEASIVRCYENYNKAYEINVTSTKRLICDLCNHGFQVIYFSTDNVFDGIKGNYTEKSPTHAINKYGEMKEEMEQYLLTNKPEVCILRLPKVVSVLPGKQNIFTEWVKQIGNGSIRCIKQNYLSFVYIGDIYQVCLLVVKKKMQGLYNIAGDEVYSRIEIVQKFYDMLGIRGISFQECSLDEFSFKDKRPLNISIDNTKFKRETGFQFMTMESVIQMYIDNMEKFIDKWDMN